MNTGRRNGINVPGFAIRCSNRAKAGPLACDGILVERAFVEGEVRQWLTDKAAEGIDAAPQAHTATAEKAANEEAARRTTARARAQAEVDKQRQALARLRAENAANPDDFGPGEYEEAADVIRKKRAEAQQLLDSIPEEAEPLPDRAEFVPLIDSTVEEWESLNTRERNLILRKLIRRVAITRLGPGTANHRVEVHPIWEPDPWPDPKKATER